MDARELKDALGEIRKAGAVVFTGRDLGWKKLAQEAEDKIREALLELDKGNLSSAWDACHEAEALIIQALINKAGS